MHIGSLLLPGLHSDLSISTTPRTHTNIQHSRVSLICLKLLAAGRLALRDVAILSNVFVESVSGLLIAAIRPNIEVYRKSNIKEAGPAELWEVIVQ